MNSLRLCVLLLSIFIQTRLVAQGVPPLERLITVDIRNATLENALREISRAGRFEFSYNPARIDGKAVVTVRLTNVPIREVLYRVFQSQVTFKSRANHVILVRNDAPEPSLKNFLLDGYILDEQTGERIAQASIFEKSTLASTVSNPFGYYRLRLPTDLSAVRLDVRKQAYVGETVLIRSRTSHSVSIRMTPIPPRLSLKTLPIRVTEDTIRPVNTLATVTVDLPAPGQDSTVRPRPKSVLEQGREHLTRLFVTAQQSIHDVNLNRDTLYRDWQVSFLPFIGTNHRLSGRISNRISVNALIGYSFGVRAFEVGGLFNLVRADVAGFQAGGLGNIVGSNVSGVQLGGLFNLDGGTVQGVQAAGLFNANMQQAQGVQLGGLFNVNAGELTHIIQVGGLFNVAGKSVYGLQLAGLANVALGDVQGWQVSGIVNRARSVRDGHQIGLINLADSVGGVPIGLFSHVKKGGYRRFEVAATEVSLLNLTYRTGVRQFYNVITTGYNFEREGSSDLTAGYGLGTGFSLSRSTLFTLEGTHHHHFYVNQPTNGGWNNQIRLSALFETKVSRLLSLAYGPSFNWYFSGDTTTPPPRRPNVPIFSEGTDGFSTSHHWGWVGFQVGLRFGNS
ncbi:STN and carboxypeptidase regulatory-like domain-containing protein [Spirosoma sp.]|uniref:STN and carboxypeptidase regulatory-like domain-containing protein n=1 Tax=Spirosoma sp. TaxID=1899569 RepID=UPI00261B019D|nr:STN and carboxypeptidase regulatory-like domain-containing protein [Spirosoma sp.]MCX6216675.1 STN and carboxypeptidase regulatory-like domain-containing protein [Spirosoma sp.]